MTPDPTAKADDEAFEALWADYTRNPRTVNASRQVCEFFFRSARQSLAPPLPAPDSADRKALVEALVEALDAIQCLDAQPYDRSDPYERGRQAGRSEAAEIATAALEAASPHPQAVEAKEGG